MSGNMNVGNLSRRRKLLVVNHRTPVSEVIENMAKSRITAACVVRRDKLVGIFTMGDVMKKVLGFKVASIWRRHQRRKFKDVPVAELMTDEPVTISADSSLSEAAEQMRRFKVRHLPVIADGSLVGIITLKDVIKALESDAGRMNAKSQDGLALMYRRDLLLSPVLIQSRSRK